jgi:lysophospholipase L1-like esterase
MKGRVVLLLLSGLVGLGLAEAVVRFGWPQGLRPAWEDELEGIRVPRPGLTGRQSVPGKFSVTVSINSQRFRARRAYATDPPAGVTRLAVLGDSVAFGWGAEDDESYPARLEALLERKAAGRFEVINAAFPGTCLGEKASWYALGVRPLRPRLVVLTALGDDVDGDLYWKVFSLDHEGRAVPTPRSRRGPAAPAARGLRASVKRLPGYEWLVERSQLFALVRRAATRAASPEGTSGLGLRPATPEDVRRFRERGLPLLRAELRWLQARVEEDGARLAVVFAPFRDEVYPTRGWWAEELRWKSRAVSDALRAACADAGLPFKDLGGELAASARAAAAPLYHEGSETHPTPLGYAAIAESVAAFLAEAALIPPGSAGP